MKTQSHTPGPWKWWDAKSGRPKNYDLAKLISGKSPQDGEVILTFYGGAGFDALKNSADAALISAAPEMLKELKHVLRFFGNDEESGLLPAGFATFNGVRAAIKKAEGK